MGDCRQNFGEGREACSSDISRNGKRRTAQNGIASFSVNLYSEEDAFELVVYWSAQRTAGGANRANAWPRCQYSPWRTARCQLAMISRARGPKFKFLGVLYGKYSKTIICCIFKRTGVTMHFCTKKVINILTE